MNLDETSDLINAETSTIYYFRIKKNNANQFFKLQTDTKLFWIFQLFLNHKQDGECRTIATLFLKLLLLPFPLRSLFLIIRIY